MSIAGFQGSAGRERTSLPSGIPEAEERGSIHWMVIKRVLDYTKPHRVKRDCVFALTVLRALQKPAVAWLLAAIINGPITAGDYQATLYWTAGFTLLLLSTGIVFHLRQRLQLELGESVIHDLRNDLYATLQGMPLGYFHKTKLGRILSRVITDIEAVRRGLQQVFFFSLLLIGQMLGAAVLMFHYNWRLFIILLGLAPMLVLINRYFHPRLSRMSRAAAESGSRLTGNLAESVRGVRVIQGFTRQGRGDQVFGKHAHQVAEDNVSLASSSALYAPLLDLGNQLFIAAILIVGGYGALHGWPGMEIGSLIAFFFLPALFFQSLQQLGNLYTQTVMSMAGAERVFQLIDLKPEWKDAKDAAALPDPRNNDVGTRNKPSGARVVFDQVYFGYDPARPVLHDISFVAKPGQSIALVGHTGSGKSSIINLISKLYLPTSGMITIDGWKVEDITSHSLRRQIGVVHQTNFLFTGTLYENIRFGKPGASDEEIEEAARQLNCHDLLSSLPNGFSTQVGEGGTSLSLGQRQLVCFARAFIADPRILILDEATSAVDPVTEHRLQQALSRLLQSRTSFVVAHRLSTIVAADQILVLEHGRVIERGTHEELIESAGRYHSLYNQFTAAGAAMASH